MIKRDQFAALHAENTRLIALLEDQALRALVEAGGVRRARIIAGNPQHQARPRTAARGKAAGGLPRLARIVAPIRSATAPG